MMSDANNGMAKTYDHHEVEMRLYEWWEQNGYFSPDTQKALGQTIAGLDPFVISMPPPNVTGALHLGHAITSSVEDMLTRYNRMLGRPSLWVPGSDHAGIATQNVVERQLESQGTNRHELGRQAFVNEVWDWKDEYHTRITAQQKRMGISCDWSRERFTLDDGLSEAVLETFIKLYNEGLIYQANYLVNWCPRCTIAISDLEVEYEEEQGRFYTFKYPLTDGDYLEVSTTRPETILGDTAVAVHPDDERYSDVIGKTAIVPILNREIPVIADEYVDPKFGTGALKVTPGHDPNDYDIGKRHDLPMINIMNRDGTLSEEAGPYADLDRLAAREKLWIDMEAADLTIRVEERPHQVGHCQRCHTIVEPLLSVQWWVKAQPLAEPAIEAVRSGAIEIVPQRFEKTYFHWMENIRDWCISRQLWWGHRIPIWYGPDNHAFAARNESDAQEQAIAHYGEAVHLEQDPDVLDTWFSSGLWPFSTLGWPEDTQDLAAYYPTTVMETGYDILFFWVARMIMLGLKCTGEIPFKQVYLHGLVRDEVGRKMSKSLDNALDPLDLIADYGSDALRFSLLTGSTPGNDMKFSITRIESNRNFANKIWNAARFVVMNLEGYDLLLDDDADIFNVGYQLPSAERLSLSDEWILSRLQFTQDEVTRLVNSWQLGEAGRHLYDFLWSAYCDWYIEAAKTRLYQGSAEEANDVRQVLAHVLEQSLRLLHPFMPYVTESIWQSLPKLATEERALIVSRWPSQTGLRNLEAEQSFERLQEAVRSIRNVRSEYNVEPGRRVAAQFSAGEQIELLTANLDIMVNLARLAPDEAIVESELEPPDQAVTLAVGGMTVYLPLAGMVDLDAERARIQKELANIEQQVQRSEKLLANPGFTSKAPPEVIDRERTKLESLAERRSQLTEHLAEL